jgi:hypothetical protein
MIRAEELRCGNYVFTDSSKSGIREIVEIRHSVVSVKYIRSDTGQLHQSMVEYERLLPIPLTEERLLKFGFTPDTITGLYIKYSLNGIDIWHDVKSGTYLLDNVKNKKIYIQYVHQLQNIYFCLCGKELTIKEEAK